MTGARLIAVAVGIVAMVTHVFAEDITPSKIFDKVKATYESMQTYRSQGIITSDIDSGAMKMNMETSFSILLKKPNLYLISWTQKDTPMPGMARSGAVWSDGTQPYLYMGMMNAYSKMGSDELALASATGISNGAAFTIPSLFLSVFKGQPVPFSRLKDPKMEKSEKIGEEDCYVVRGGSTISKEEAFWISKSRSLILKYYRSLEPPEGGVATPEITDAQLEEALKGMGQQVTEESKQKMREMMETSMDALKAAQFKGFSTELHTEISLREMDAKAFEFAVPEGAVLKDSLLGGVLGGRK